MRGVAVVLVIMAASVTLAGCSDRSTNDVAATSTTTAADPARIPSVPVPVPSDRFGPPVPSTDGAPTTAAGPGCDVAPAKIVDPINAAFANGEHLENTQSVSGPSGTVIVGGNIVDPAGTRVLSADSWVMSGGSVYGLSSDARRHTLLPDGRRVIDDWTTYNDAVGDCVVAATRAANR